MWIIMSKKLLIGKKFGRLTVIERSESILGGDKVKRYWGAWKCRCDCGNYKIVKTVDLNKGSVKSCGCIIKKYGTALRPGQRFGRLVTISYNKGKWLCRCDCGIVVNNLTIKLTSGNSKSCGCYNADSLSNRIGLLINARMRENPEINIAKRVWKEIYCDGDIKFDDFYRLSQFNCYYCGIYPNYTKVKNVSKYSRFYGLDNKFTFNGLDRIKNNRGHYLYNVVTCCKNCNRYKSDMDLSEFYEKIKSFKVRNDL